MHNVQIRTVQRILFSLQVRFFFYSLLLFFCTLLDRTFRLFFSVNFWFVSWKTFRKHAFCVVSKGEPFMFLIWSGGPRIMTKITIQNSHRKLGFSNSPCFANKDMTPPCFPLPAAWKTSNRLKESTAQESRENKQILQQKTLLCNLFPCRCCFGGIRLLLCFLFLRFFLLGSSKHSCEQVRLVGVKDMIKPERFLKMLFCTTPSHCQTLPFTALVYDRSLRDARIWNQIKSLLWKTEHPVNNSIPAIPPGFFGDFFFSVDWDVPLVVLLPFINF